MIGSHKMKNPDAKLFKSTRFCFCKMQPKDLEWKDVTPHATFNYVEKKEQFDKDDKKFMTTTALRYEGQSVKVLLKGEIVTNGINVASFDQNVHSLGLSLSDPEDLENLQELTKPFSHIFTDFPEDWEVKDLLRNDVLYLKLKTKDGKYRFKSDIKMDPENPKKVGIARSDTVEVKVEVQAYINFKQQSGGFFLDVLDIKTKTSPAKRRKRED